MSRLTTREVLTEARQLITPPGQWAGPKEHVHESSCYCAATAIEHVHVHESSCYCAATAIWSAAGNMTSTPEAVPAGDALAKAAGLPLPSEEWKGQGPNSGGWTAIYDWNDKTTHDVVLSAFDRAIEEQPV